MSQIDVIGMRMEEAVKLMEVKTNVSISISETNGLNNKFINNLNEPRVLRAVFNKNSVKFVIGYF